MKKNIINKKLKDKKRVTIKKLSMDDFFYYSLEFYNFFKELNETFSDLYNVSFVSPSLINSFEGVIKNQIKDKNNLTIFKENFNNFADYDKYESKDIDYYKKMFIDNISLFSLPTYFESVLLSNINTIFDPENDYIEEDHINCCQTHIKNIIKAGLKETKLIPKDKRWLKLV